MGESKQRRKTNRDYGVDRLRKSLVAFLNENNSIRGDGAWIPVFEGTPTKERLISASSIFSNWLVENRPSGEIALCIGNSYEEAVLVGIFLDGDYSDLSEKGIRFTDVIQLLADLTSFQNHVQL